jgi:hypothetical protein
MYQFKKLIIVSLCFLFSFSVHAVEKVLCTVISDLDSDVGQLVYEMDQDQRAIQHLYQDTYKAGKRVSRAEMKTSDLTKGGIALSRKDKYILVRIWSDNFDQERGGMLYLDTLYSALSGERREDSFDLVMDKNGPVLIHKNQEFHQMKVIAKRSPILGPIGIEKILFSK